jgi:hypothetical protein
MFGRSKTSVDKLEEEFKTDSMRNRHIFFDMNVRAADPEEVRSYTTQLMTDLEFKTILNEMSSFDDVEFEKIFRGGRLKPVKCVIKGIREHKKGPRYKMLYKLLALIGTIVLFVSLMPPQWLWLSVGQTTLLITATVSLIASVVVYSVKKVVPSSLWVKVAGIYDVESEKSDLRIIISADLVKSDKMMFIKLEEDVTEFYNILSDKYVKPYESAKKKPKKLLIESKAEPAEGKVRSAISEIDNEIFNLDRQLAQGKVTEKTYTEAKASLSKRKEKLGIIIDLLTSV